MSVPTCPRCAANHSAPGSVIYTERYVGYLGAGGADATVFADTFSVDSSASCARCGAELPFHDADLSRGGFLGERHVAGVDDSGGGGFVPVWCACGWMSGASDVEIARTIAREHEQCPPRYEIRLVDARHGAVDLRPDGWLASASEIDTLRGPAEEIDMELWNDARRAVCVWDSVERRVVWGEGCG